MRPPSTVANSNWPPNYIEIWQWRQQQLVLFREKPELIVGALQFYRDRPIDFINHWCDVYEPRNAGTTLPTRLPFIMFQRQQDLVNFLLGCLAEEESGLIEKSRDMGATFICCALSVWMWRFWPGVAVGWGSRKEDLVDKLGDTKSVFEKMRAMIRGLPPFFLPKKFNARDHLGYMKIVNPDNEATITGEAGDNIGRGGRTRIYFKDESAHYGHPEAIEASLSENTRVQIDLSSVNGLGNVFHRRREAGVEWTGGEIVKGRTNVFVMDWREHPDKTLEWYAAKKQKFKDDGLDHVFAQEVDRNYSAAVLGTIIPAEHVLLALDAHLRYPELGITDTGRHVAALDVADGDEDSAGDVNALAWRKGVILKGADFWGGLDTGETTRKTVQLLSPMGGGVDIQYDCIGVGAGVKSEANRLKSEGLLTPGLSFAAWSAADSPLWPDEPLERGDQNSPLNGDFYANLKAQGWWLLRRRFERLFNAITRGIKFDPALLISISTEGFHPATLRQLQKELSQPTAGKHSGSMKLLVNKTPKGTRSPNLGDAVMMCYHPVESVGPLLIPAGVLARSMVPRNRLGARR